MKINYKALFKALICNLFLLGVLFILSLFLNVDWNSFRQATSMPNNAFNEAIRNGFIRQPWNTISSFFYSLVGFYILFFPLQKENKNKLSIKENKILKNIFSASLIICGLGSAYLHLSLTYIGQTTDVMGMYLIGVFIILYSFRNKSINFKKFIIYFIIINIILFIPLIFLPELRRSLFALIIFTGLLLEYFCNCKNKNISFKYLLISLLILLVGFIFWIIDNNRLFFNPYSFFQGHVIWHLTGSIACYTLYIHYNKEQ